MVKRAITGLLSVAVVAPVLASCNSYGLHGMDVHKTPRAANRAALEERAAYGEVDGLYKLGMAHIQGKDGDMNFTEGTRLLCKAAYRGHKHAMAALGTFYAEQADTYPIAPSSDGIISTPGYDMVGYAWYTIAERNDVTGIARAKQDLLRTMDMEASRRAIVMADSFPDTPCQYPPEGF